MTNKQEQLHSRGYIENGIEANFANVSFDKKIELLESNVASERTLGARLLRGDKASSTVDKLVKALKKEKKLYPKIEICNSLSEMSEKAIIPLIECLGKIGNNQHKTVPQKDFLKDSYPLPRDIASRTLIRIGRIAIPELLNKLSTQNRRVLSELIDTIGHINFNARIENIYRPLKQCYHQHESEDLIKWKIIRAFSGIDESEVFLRELQIDLKEERLKKEIERSIRLIEFRKIQSE